MYSLTRRLSMVTAKASTRRGFLSSAARGLVAAGLGVGFLLGSERLAYALNCVHCGSGCGATGCPGLNGPCANCPTSPVECPATYRYIGCNTCCCSGYQYRCTLCSVNGFIVDCTCHHTDNNGNPGCDCPP